MPSASTVHNEVNCATQTPFQSSGRSPACDSARQQPRAVFIEEVRYRCYLDELAEEIVLWHRIVYAANFRTLTPLVRRFACHKS